MIITCRKQIVDGKEVGKILFEYISAYPFATPRVIQDYFVKRYGASLSPRLLKDARYDFNKRNKKCVNEFESKWEEWKLENVTSDELDDALSALDKAVEKLQKRWVNVKIDYNAVVNKHEPKRVEPFVWGDSDNILVIWDIHCPVTVDWYLEFCREQQERFNCWRVVYIWDIVDFNSISYHEKIPEILNPKWEIDSARTMLKDWYYTFPTATVLLGNHDCHSDDTMLLTQRWFINHWELQDDDLVWTMSKSWYIEYQKPMNYFSRRYKWEMHRFSWASTDVLVTPNHRMLIHHNRIWDNKYELAENIFMWNNSKRSFCVSFLNNNIDYSIDDRSLELLWYIYWDGSMNRWNFQIYQRLSNSKKIEDCLVDMWVNFKRYDRERTIDSICWKPLINKTNIHSQFVFKRDEVLCLKNEVFNRYLLPSFLSKISSRQFNIFIDALCYCDANVQWSYFQLDWRLEFLKQIEVLLISHWYCSRICEYRPWSYRIVSNKDRRYIMYAQHTVEQYDWNVRCLTTENTNFIVKRNNCISVQGNCLPYRQARSSWLLREFIKDPNTIFEAPIWYNFVNEIIINNVLYTHWTNWNAFKKCVNEWMSLVQWHLHTQWWVQYHRSRNWQIFWCQVWTWIDFEQTNFDYAKTTAKKAILSCAVILKQWDTNLPIVIPMI